MSKLISYINNKNLLSAYTEHEQNIEKVLSIFIRMNSGGTPLSYSDLLLSFTVTQWTTLNAREEINDLIEEINSDTGFKFDKDLILRAGLMLGEVGNLSFKLSNFSKENIVFMENHWEDVKESFLVATQILKSFGIDNQSLLSHSAILPIVYYVFRKKLLITDDKKLKISHEDQVTIKNWILTSFLKKGLWSSNLESLLVHIRTAIGQNPIHFPIDAINIAMLEKEKALSFNEEDIRNLCDLRYGKDAEIKALLLLIFPDSKLVETHIDHIYPKSIFTLAKMKKLNIKNDGSAKFQIMANTIANLQLIPASVNIDKKATQPAQWLDTYFSDTASKQLYLSSQLIEELSTNLNQFEKFYLNRREKIENKLRQILDVKTLNTSYKNDDVLGKLKLNHACLTPTQIKFIEKISTWLNIDKEQINLKFILNELSQQTFTTKVDNEPADAVKNSLIVHLYKILDDFDKSKDLKQQAYDSGYFKIDDQDTLTTFELDRYIAEDLASFEQFADPRHVEVLQKRFGLTQQEPMTLEEVGGELNVTRERIRQIEKKALIDLRQRMRVSINTIWENLNQNATNDMQKLYPQLAGEFSDIKHFLAFLDLLCEFNKNELAKVIFPDINVHSLLEEWSLSNKLPISQLDTIGLIQDNEGCTEQVARNAIYHQYQEGKLRLLKEDNEDIIYPIGLNKMPVLVQASLHFNENQNFKEIQQKANELNICNCELPLDRQDQAITEAVNKNYLFQSDRGGYSHIRYFPISREQHDIIFTEVQNILNTQPNDSINLRMQVYENNELLKKYDYFTIRHLIRNFGEEEGIYFNGRSGADTISLQEGVKSQGQLQTILNLMQSSGKPITRNSLAKQIRSGSEGHASFYINELIDAGKVVRISAHEYALAENAYKGIDTEKLLQDILLFLKHSNIPTEVGVLAEKLNIKYHFSYPKAWYLHLIKSQNKDDKREIYTFHNLVALNELEELSVHKLIRELELDLNDFDKVYASISKYILVGRTEVKNAVNNLRNSKT